MVTEEAVELDELLEDFERWLKRDKGISSYEGAARERDRIRAAVRKILEQMPPPLSRQLIYEAVKEETDKVEPWQHRHPLKLFLQFFSEYYWAAQEGIEEQREAQESAEEGAIPVDSLGLQEAGRDEEREIPLGMIGRVAVTFRTPAKPSQWYFWVKDDPNIHIEPGQLVTAQSEDGDMQVTVTGIVTDVQAYSDIESVTDSFYGHGYGNPEERLPSRPTVITVGEAETVFRSDSKAEPIRGSWPVRFAEASEIRQAYGADIEPRYQVIGGFTYDHRRRPVSVPLDVRYLLGLEGAHVNIAGASGAATKTSYGLFLLLSLLAYSQSQKAPPDFRGGIAAIAFNVKEADLMRIDELPATWDDVKKRLQAPRDQAHLKLWDTLLNPPDGDPIYTIDPWHLRQRFRFFAPQRADGSKITSRRPDRTEGFAYGCMDLVDTHSLHMLLDPRDLDDLSTAVIADLTEEMQGSPGSFDDARTRLQGAVSGQDGQYGRGAAGRRDDWVTIGQGVHHRSTVLKVLNRLQHAVQNQLAGLLNPSDTRACPIPIDELRGGALWVIDISKIHDKGQRLIFHSVVRTIYRLLEAKRTGERYIRVGSRKADAEAFPSRVVVLVDELNKFAPSRHEYSAIKEDIVEIAARGRSVGLALIGIQQLASKVDDEVITNSNTLVVGRTHAAEIRNPAYNWLPAGLKERAVALDKGWMLLWHAGHKRPVFVHFPIPLHCLTQNGLPRAGGGEQ